MLTDNFTAAVRINASDEDWQKIRLLILGRIFFALLLIFVSIVMYFSSQGKIPLIFCVALICVASAILFLSLIYSLIINHTKYERVFIFVQLLFDTTIVTALVFITGSFLSLYSFLYLIVIICSSVFLNKRDCIIIALLCSIQFGIMIDLEYYGIIQPLTADTVNLSEVFSLSQIMNKVLTTMLAFIATALLSSFIADQEKKAKGELRAMQEHVKRVEKMAAAGEIAAGLAHEIKNPLASLSGSIQMLKEVVEFHPDYDRLMQIALREADRLSSLVTEFMQFAKPIQGKVEPVNPGQVVDEVIDFFLKGQKKEGAITIDRDINDSLWIQIDSGQLKQVILNVLLNAQEASPECGCVSIRVYRKQKNVCISIKDEGPGVPDDIRDLIFDPFYTTRPTGAGLGLAIVHRIVSSYNGNVEFHNAKTDGGTIFSIQFPECLPPKLLS